jgi:antitoxin Phd
MLSVTATELKNRLGRYLETAQREPVMIAKSGRESTVVLSKEHYDRLLGLEDQLWDLRAQLAEREGFVGPAKLAKLIPRSR